MKAELENLIDVCRQVTRWADAPTPKGDFPKQFVDRLLVTLRDLPEMTVRDVLWQGLHWGPFTVHENNAVHEDMFHVLDSSNDAVVSTPRKVITECVCNCLNMVYENEPKGGQK